MLLLIGLCVANLGTCAAKPPLWSMPTQFRSAAAAAIGLINAVGSLGGCVRRTEDEQGANLTVNWAGLFCSDVLSIDKIPERFSAEDIT